MTKPRGSFSHTYSHFAMNCNWQVSLRLDSSAQQSSAERGVAELFEGVDRLERDLSRFLPDSDIGRFNALSAQQSTQVSMETIECLLLALQLFAATDGAFDVSLGTGLDSIRLHTESRTLQKTRGETQLDLGSIGKGYALDQLVVDLTQWGLAPGLAHCGQSSVVAFGGTLDVDIRDPRNPEQTIATIPLRDQSLSGSSNYLYGAHVVDPTSGSAAAHALGSWCVAGRASLSDALATCGLLVPSQRLEAIRESGSLPEIGWLLASTDDPPKLQTVGAWPPPSNLEAGEA